jgi:hypothetical protein
VRDGVCVLGLCFLQPTATGEAQLDGTTFATFSSPKNGTTQKCFFEHSMIELPVVQMQQQMQQHM